MSKHDFFHSTPNDVLMFMDCVSKNRTAEAKQIEYTAWLNGLYVRMAIVSALNGRKSKYPSNPLSEEKQNGNGAYIVATEAMTEEDKERTRQLFLANLQEMQSNFEGKG